LLIKDGEALSEVPQLIGCFESNPRSVPLPSWYVLYVSSRHEKSVASQLAIRTIDNFLPLYRVVHSWKNRCRRMLDLPLFPNYLFARIAPQNR
jgi:transcription antitermination factor NusG